MFCPKCGNEIDDEAIMCPKCGCALESVQTEKPKKKQSVWSLVGFGIGAVMVIYEIILAVKDGTMYDTLYGTMYDKLLDNLVNMFNAPLLISIFMTAYFGKTAFER